LKKKARLGTVHKNVCSQGGGGLFSADILRTKGREVVLQLRKSTIFGTKNIGFLKFMVRPHG